MTVHCQGEGVCRVRFSARKSEKSSGSHNNNSFCVLVTYSNSLLCVPFFSPFLKYCLQTNYLCKPIAGKSLVRVTSLHKMSILVQAGLTSRGLVQRLGVGEEWGTYSNKLFLFPPPTPLPIFHSLHLLPQQIFPCPNSTQLPNPRWQGCTKMYTCAPKIYLHGRLVVITYQDNCFIFHILFIWAVPIENILDIHFSNHS